MIYCLKEVFTYLLIDVIEVLDDDVWKEGKIKRKISAAIKKNKIKKIN